MDLVQNVKEAFTRVASEFNALKTNNAALAQALLDLDQSITELQSRPFIVISETQPTNPVEGMVWLDTSGG